MTEVSFADRVRIRTTPETETLGLAGKCGTVYGQTTPSVTGVEVIGAAADDCAICVNFDDTNKQFWFAPNLVEFVDHAPGTTAKLGDKSFVREANGEWREYKPT